MEQNVILALECCGREYSDVSGKAAGVDSTGKQEMRG
jgi:hypothetical protein